MNESRSIIADLVKAMMYASGKTREETADFLGIKYDTFCNLLRIKSRSKSGRTFDVAEMVSVAEFCGFKIILNGKGVSIDLIEFVHRNDKVLNGDEKTSIDEVKTIIEGSDSE